MEIEVYKSERSHLILTRIAAQIFQLGLENHFAGAEVVNSMGQTQSLYKLLRCRNMIYEKNVFCICFFLGVLTVEKAEVTFKLVH